MSSGIWYKTRVLLWGEVPESALEKRLVRKLDTVILVSHQSPETKGSPFIDLVMPCVSFQTSVSTALTFSASLSTTLTARVCRMPMFRGCKRNST